MNIIQVFKQYFKLNRHHTLDIQDLYTLTALFNLISLSSLLSRNIDIKTSVQGPN